MAYQFDPQIIARLLTGLGGAASAYGAGSPQWGYAGIQAVNAQQEQQRQAAQDRLRDTLLQQQIQQQQQAATDAAAQKAAAKSWLLGQTPASGLYNGQGRPGPSTATPGALSTLPAAHQDFYKGYAGIDPVAAAQMAGQEMLKDPAKPDAPILQDFDEGGNVVKKQWDPKTNTWTALSTAPRWQPPAPPQMPGDYQIYLAEKKADPTIKSYSAWKQSQSTPKQPGITNLYGPNGTVKSLYENDPAIPGLLSSGYTGVAPKGSAKDMTPEDVAAQGLPKGTVAQRDENNNIKVVSSPKDPPADIQEYLYAKSQGFNGTYLDYAASKKGQAMTVTSPDGTVVQVGGSVKPPNESQMAAASRAQLIKDGLASLEALYDNPDISPVRVAGADTLDNFGPFGKLAAGNMQSDAEQQFAAAKASALEGLAASVTGAGVAKDQFTRYEQMLPALTDKPETRKAKLQAANNYLNTLLANAGAAAMPVNNSGKPTAGTADTTIPADLPAGSAYAGQTKDGKRAFKLPDGSLVSEP